MPYHCFEAEPKSNQCLHFVLSTYVSCMCQMREPFRRILNPSGPCTCPGDVHASLNVVSHVTVLKKKKKNLPLICSLKMCLALSYKFKLSLKY